MKVKLNRKPPLVKIRCYDVQSLERGWQPAEQIKRWIRNEHWPRLDCVGYLIAETKRYYILAAQLQNSGDFYGMVQRIPRGAVEKLERL